MEPYCPRTTRVQRPKSSSLFLRSKVRGGKGSKGGSRKESDRVRTYTRLYRGSNRNHLYVRFILVFEVMSKDPSGMG